MLWRIKQPFVKKTFLNKTSLTSFKFVQKVSQLYFGTPIATDQTLQHNKPTHTPQSLEVPYWTKTNVVGIASYKVQYQPHMPWWSDI